MKRFFAPVLFGMFCCAKALAVEPFIISDIRVEGVQRISEGTVFNYLPLDVGDLLTAGNTRTAIRELYKTGFFSDIQFGREGDILVITLFERPAISSINLDGNKAIKSEELLAALSDIGLSEGEVFDRMQLDRVQQELTRQYFSQGKYSVSVDTRVSELDRNRVRINFDIDEGKTAKIKHINIVGNTVFDEDELREAFESDIPNRLIFWSKADQYSREKLSGDLEKLRSYYQDRGYVDFSIESTQVSISPDKQDIYITANVREGDVYTISDVQLTGDLVLDEAVMRNLVAIEPDEVFSRRKLEASIENITAILANIGYAFANVTPAPSINRDDKTVGINLFIEPGKRVYVRRVLFIGNNKTKDEVLRREMRQLEGAWFSQAAIDRSKLRMQRLSFFEEVNIETPAVPGSDDQIDVIVTVEERAAGSFSIGLGFSQLQGIIASFSINQDNFLGSGKRVGLALSRSSILTQFDLSYTNPYWTDDGISLGYFLRYREFDQAEANISTFTTSEAAIGLTFGVPITEVDFVRTGLAARQTDINIGSFFREDDIPDPNSPDPSNPDFICNDADMDGICPETYIVPVAGDPLSQSLDLNGDGQLSGSERRIDTYQLDASWTRDTRNHFLNPTRGSRQQFGVELALPGSSREYYKAFYRYSKYFPLTDWLTMNVHGDVGWGDNYDSVESDPITPDTNPELFDDNGLPIRVSGSCNPADIVLVDNGLPFFEHFYGGGVRDVRGFDDNTLGPKDRLCRAVGGDLKVSGGLEFAFPTPFLGGRGGTRLALFFDIGQVYQDFDAFEADELRYSTGLSLTWEAPVGPVIINFAIPLNDKEGDRTEELQFSFGGQF